MGVHGLWRLVDASGKPVPLETLEGKVLAIDVSIWIHQVLQGYQDRRGSAVPNAHLLGLFHRICKLLYFKIKPVFVFDGGVPMLKKNTIASRKKQKAIAASKAQQMKHDLIQNLIKHTAVKGVLALGNGEKQSTSSQESSVSKNPSSAPDMFKLPSLPVQNESLSDETLDDCEDYDSETSLELSPRKQARWKGNIHSVDVTSADFKALPADVRYDVLTDLKETRKQNSWGRLHEMPEVSHEFSIFQMQRLLKRRRVQESLESAEKEMGGRTLTLEELEQLLTEQGIATSSRDNAFRIASDSTTRLIYINDPKGLQKSNGNEEIVGKTRSPPREACDSKAFVDLDNAAPKVDAESLIADINEYDLDSDWLSDDEIAMSEEAVETSALLSNKYVGKQRFDPAFAYMLEHAGLEEQDQILALIEDSKGKSSSDFKEKTRDAKTLVLPGSSIKISEEHKDPCIGEASSSKSISDFDKLINEVPEVLKVKSDRKSSPDVEHFDSDNSITELPQVVTVETPEKAPANVRTNENLASDVGASCAPKAPTSDSDTDSDLVEIHDVSIPTEKIDTSLEIIVKSDEILKDEDDLFADVFATESRNVSEISTQDNSSINDSAASASFGNIEVASTSEIGVASTSEIEVASTSEIEVATSPTESRDKDVPPEILVESQQNEPAIDIPISQSTNVEAVVTPSRAEELNEQVAKFKPALLQANHEKLVTMQAELENEHSDLTENIGKLERQATDVTDQMRMEAQDLLRLFGIPYVVAPMEAEAQCAFLESNELTDGTVTDDSDIWLFGGRCVYKNFFNNNKRVMQYKLQDIEHHFKLTRQQMIQLALLVGSDYTVGVSGIGPVTALEILAAFPTDGDDLLRGLGNFCSWLRTGRATGPGRTTLRNKLRNVEIEKGFPSQAVVQAYLFPTVDESKEPFTWSKPNLTLLADYTRQKFGWTKLKFEETIGPVVKKLAEAKSQRGITSYFAVNTVPKSIVTTMSKRVQKAVRRLANGAEHVDDAELPEIAEPKEKKKRGGKRAKKSEDTVDSRNSTELLASSEPLEINASTSNAAKIPNLPDTKNVDEYIPQREKDRAIAQKKKLRAIEVFKKSKKGPGRSKKPRRPSTIVTKEAKLSESSDSS